MKAITLGHSDMVSGMTITDNGTLVIWTEGRSSHVDIIYPTGYLEMAQASAFPTHPVLEAADHALEHDEMRPMTSTEERIYDALRGIAWRYRNAVVDAVK